MLTVYSVYWGDKYSADYVYLLRDMVARNLSVPHLFKCITDHELDGIDTIKPIEPSWEGWWQKIQIFHFADGPSLYFDLDVVITDSLDQIARYAAICGTLAAAKNWGQSGHGGIQSSVMAWDGTFRAPYQEFDYEKDSKRLWGDQEFLSELLEDNYFALPGVYSYKYHCRDQGKPPEDAAVIAFHGKPDPHECNEQWIKQSRYILTHA